MDNTKRELINPQPGAIKALLAGFEAISNHLGLIFFPLLLDLFLWLGPQVKLEYLLNNLIKWTFENGDPQTKEFANLMEANQVALAEIGKRFNLLSTIRTFPIGVPSLMLSKSTSTSPNIKTIVWQVPNSSSLFIIWLGLLLIGLIFGTIYFYSISQAALKNKIQWKIILTKWPWYLLQIILLTIFWLALIIGVSIPFSCILPFILSGSVSTILLIIFSGIIIWILFPLIFVPHGIFVYRYSLWKAIRASIRIVKMTLPKTIGLILAILVISQGFDLLWNRIPADSWMTIVALLGHAMIATSLIAATFIYYQNANVWIETIAQNTSLPNIKT